jgi:CheY-like chemotaxis protein
VKVGASSNGRVILCVDDEAVGLSVRKMLLEAQGYRVLTAENGPDALVLFSSEDVEAIVLDYSMPGMNGDVVAERMKELRPDLPIIMLSAYVDLPSATLALVDRSITKGEPPPVLLEAIVQVLDGNRNARSKAISAK